MKSIFRQIEKNFFVITRDNCAEISSRLYGIIYQGDSIYANCDLNGVDIRPYMPGCYIGIKVNTEGQIINMLTDCCQSLCVYVYNNGFYWAISNSFFLLCEEVKKKFPYKHVELITGSISSKQRDEIKQTLKENNDCILIASYGVMSTGITLANLCFGVLFESFKSNVVNMQSIGRGLGLSYLKEKYTLYDIIDCFDSKALTNKIYLQGLTKCKIYDEIFKLL